MKYLLLLATAVVLSGVEWFNPDHYRGEKAMNILMIFLVFGFIITTAFIFELVDYMDKNK